MSGPTKEQVIDILRTVNDPELHRDLVALEMVKNVAVNDGRVNVHVELTTPACPLKATIHDDVTKAVQSLDGVRQVEVEFSARVRSAKETMVQLPGVKNIIAIGSGKGGVGKSTAAVLLAVGLQRQGAQVGLMDADVYGPSIPTMLQLAGAQPKADRKSRILPVIAQGVKVMSMGFLVPPDLALIWRGPMVHKAVKQFLEQVDWGELDYLIVDLPPGTGDVPLTLTQSIPLTGAVIVCTPQDVALIDARRATQMYQQLDIDVLGIIENMSYYICPHCGHRDEIFDHGGVRRAAVEMGLPYLGEIPLNTQIRVHGDRGDPEQCFTGINEKVHAAIENVVQNLAGQISVKNMQQNSAAGPSIPMA
jgi:ATP-binding protein involved in chromosome partitioning